MKKRDNFKKIFEGNDISSLKFIDLFGIGPKILLWLKERKIEIIKSFELSEEEVIKLIIVGTKTFELKLLKFIGEANFIISKVLEEDTCQ